MHTTKSCVCVYRATGGFTGTLPTSYTSWLSLRAFELAGTQLSGAIPSAYTTAWLSLNNFTLDGAQVMGYVPDPFSWSNLTWYTVQNTPVSSDATQPFWVLKPQAASLTQLKGLRLGEWGALSWVEHTPWASSGFSCGHHAITVSLGLTIHSRQSGKCLSLVFMPHCWLECPLCAGGASWQRAICLAG